MDTGTSLLELQEVDLAITRAQKRLDEMPEKRAILEARKKQREVGALHAKALELVSRLEREVAKSEDESASITDKITSEQQKIMSGEITNPKELQHITREMDALKRRRDKLEIDEVAQLERVDKAKGQVAKVEQALEQLKAKEEQFIAEFKDKGGQLQSEIEQMTVRRTRLAGSLPPELLSRYETLREAKQGMGVGKLDGARCTACRIELPAERVKELETGGPIATCPNCRRMLVIAFPEE